MGMRKVLRRWGENGQYALCTYVKLSTNKFNYWKCVWQGQDRLWEKFQPHVDPCRKGRMDGGPWTWLFPLDLVSLTGYLPKPSLLVQHLRQVTTGEKVNLQCQKPHSFTQYKMFALLKEGTSSPIQLLNSENDTVEFTLEDVTVHDAGRYSCVYLQAEAPFRASHPSDHLNISVASKDFMIVGVFFFY